MITPSVIDLDGLKPMDFGKTWRWITTGRMPDYRNAIEVFVGGAWCRHHRNGGGSHHTKTGCVEYFCVEHSDREFKLVDEGPVWRWPVTNSESAPTPEPTEPTITLKKHHASLFAIRINDALYIIASLSRLHESHLFISRIVLRLATQIVSAAETLRPLENRELTYMRTVFLGAHKATERLQQEDAAVRRSVRHLDDYYRSRTPLFAVEELRDFIKHDIIGTPPERLKLWERLRLEWASVNPEAANLAQLFTQNPDSDTTP